jgi:hypothetical protein
MRSIGMVGLLTALATASASADDARKPCLGAVYGGGEKIDPYSRTDQLDLTDNQCESVTGKELRLKLIEVPQEEEDPMSLSVGAKNLGGVLRFKIPFSF